MEWLSQGLALLSRHLSPHISSIATIWVSTLLVVYGNDINRSLKRLVRHWHITWRYIFFPGFRTKFMQLADFKRYFIFRLSKGENEVD